ncbi:unnamed protein product [Cuscuta epithymum]|uniref:Pentatricopeptide repeat-containing protein n=1 Tax=Cuscuta epithymum TaxID=186058 RepID=A0AAV0DDG0_9ASTE|nr:unnamed protein product [Cuscuta epithymum]
MLRPRMYRHCLQLPPTTVILNCISSVATIYTAAAEHEDDPFKAHPCYHHLSYIKSKGELLQSYTVTPPIQPWPRNLTHKRLISLISCQNDPNMALHIFHHAGKYHPGFSHNYETYHRIILKLCRARAFESVDTLLAELRHTNITCSENLFVTVIRNYGIASKPKQAIKSFLKIKDFGIVRGKNRKSYWCWYVEIGSSDAKVTSPRMVKWHLACLDAVGLNVVGTCAIDTTGC